MRRAEPKGVVLLALLGIGVGSCNELTGANQYEETERCTGPTCGVCPAGQTWDPGTEVCIDDSLWCGMQGGQWESAQQMCLPEGTCPQGRTWVPEQKLCIDDSLWCGMQGGQWDRAQQMCLPEGMCPAGQRWYAATNACIPLCSTGVECGANCCPNGLNCVDEATGRCSECKTAALICGTANVDEQDTCCEEGSTCTNAERKVCSTPYGVVGQSCAGGLTCGKGESCCESILVPGGTFPMGSPAWDPSAVNDEFPEHEVTVSTYSLDKYEVTVGRFRAFVESFETDAPPQPGAGAHPRISGSGWRAEWNAKLPGNRAELETVLECGFASTWSMARGGTIVACDGTPTACKDIGADQDTQYYGCCDGQTVYWCEDQNGIWEFRSSDCAGNGQECGQDPSNSGTMYCIDGLQTLPINCVNWYEAFAFCAWDGGRLPTEAEWEYAAAGGEENWRYPWGPTAPTPDWAVFDCLYGSESPEGCDEDDMAVVGSKPLGAGRWDHQDLAGNMFEWVLDVFGGYEEQVCNDCANAANVPVRVLRGGSWGNSANDLRAAFRLGFTSATHDNNIGFRCSRTP